MEKGPPSGDARGMTTLVGFDYAPWLVKEYWSLTEAAKLLCGRDPNGKIPGMQLFNKSHRVIDLIDRAFAVAQGGEIKVVRPALLPIHLLIDPFSFLRWAVQEGLDVPPPLKALAERQPEATGAAIDALLKERVMTIARTLWLLHPKFEAVQIAYHEVMLAQVPESELRMADRLAWIDLVKSANARA